MGLLSLFAEMEINRNQLLRNSAGRLDSMRVDEGRSLAERMKARTAVGRGKNSLFSGPGSELGLDTERERQITIDINSC